MSVKNISLIFLGLLIISAYAVSADTGTYVIQKQNTDLIISNNTDVVISYDVDFTVTGGNIPWVTMGLPTSNYEILSYGGAIKSIRPANSGGWTGVRIDLDKTYYSGSTFTYNFSVLQKRFVVPYNGRASVQFTPVYWDNAPIKNMQLRFVVPPGVTDVKTSDSAAIFGKDNSVTWQFTNIPNGARKTVGLTMPINNTFPTLQGSGGSSSGVPSDGLTVDPGVFGQVMIWGLVAFIIIIAVAFILSASSSGSSSNIGDDYTPPELFLNSASSGKKTKRNLHLSCVNDKSGMEEVTVASDKYTHGIPAALCLVCGALFFDKGNIEKAFKANLKESEFNKNQVKFGGSISSPRDTCPRCDGKLKLKTESKDSTSANIYYCKECGGVWLERGEYTNVKKLFELQKAELASKGKSLRSVDNDHWLFYPYIYYPYVTGGHVSSSSSSGGGSYSGGHYGGGGSSSCVASSCACVSCACVACACACACAGGGAAGCSPKDKFNQIHLYDGIREP